MKNKTFRVLVPDFVTGADYDNIYRTEQYIVTQVLVLQSHPTENNVLMSYDTFYRRSKQRDLQYELMFGARSHINGKRLPSTVYTRKYVE